MPLSDECLSPRLSILRTLGLIKLHCCHHTHSFSPNIVVPSIVAWNNENKILDWEKQTSVED